MDDILYGFKQARELDGDDGHPSTKELCLTRTFHMFMRTFGRKTEIPGTPQWDLCEEAINTLLTSKDKEKTLEALGILLYYQGGGKYTSLD